MQHLEGDRADVRALVPSTGTAGLPVFRLVGSGSQSVLRAEFLRRVGSEVTEAPVNVRFIAATSRTSSGIGFEPPTRSTVFVSRNRSSLGWTSSGRSPISSRNRVPLLANSSRPGLFL